MKEKKDTIINQNRNNKGTSKSTKAKVVGKNNDRNFFWITLAGALMSVSGIMFVLPRVVIIPSAFGYIWYVLISVINLVSLSIYVFLVKDSAWWKTFFAIVATMILLFSMLNYILMLGADGWDGVGFATICYISLISYYVVAILLFIIYMYSVKKPKK